MSVRRRIALAAGGTGGHLFPALALAGVLRARGYAIVLLTDERGARYDGRFPADVTHIVPSDTVRSRNPVALARTVFTLGRGVLAARGHLAKRRPEVVIGFGGYPSLPPLFAARTLGLPIVLHEQNAVLGRANKAMARSATRVAFGFAPKETGALDAGKIIVTGNPVRAEVLTAAAYQRTHRAGRFRLLIFGGSQGARVFSDILPEAIATLPEAAKAMLDIVQQARAEDVDRVRARYSELGVRAEIASFFADMPMRIAMADLVIGRAGASTVSELSAIGRPSFLVPLPHALDQDQAANARVLSEAGGARVVPQTDFTPAKTATLLTGLMNDATTLAAMARAARSVGRHDAAERLADVVEDVISERRS